MSSAWFFLPTVLRDKLFTVHGTLGFALVLAAWMYSDVPSTNVLGPDAERVVSAIDDPVMMRRLLNAKYIVLWALVTPLCAVVAVVNGLINHSFLSTLYTVIVIGILPFGFLAITAWVGILFPYHPMPLRYRYEHRKPLKRMLIRWARSPSLPMCWSRSWPPSCWCRRSFSGDSPRRTVCPRSCPITTSDSGLPLPASSHWVVGSLASGSEVEWCTRDEQG